MASVVGGNDRRPTQPPSYVGVGGLRGLRAEGKHSCPDPLEPMALGNHHPVACDAVRDDHTALGAIHSDHWYEVWLRRAASAMSCHAATSRK